jgi:16S rRNA processing protein RimM
VTGVYGVRGWVRLRSDTEPPAGLLDYSPWLLRRDDGWREFEPLEGRVHRTGLVASLAGVDAREAAGRLVGADIGIRRAQLQPLEPGEHYWVDLLGLEVRNREGRVLGTVARLLETGANDVLVVVGDRERLVPYLVGRVIDRVDLAGGVIEVDWDADF